MLPPATILKVWLIEVDVIKKPFRFMKSHALFQTDRFWQLAYGCKVLERKTRQYSVFDKEPRIRTHDIGPIVHRRPPVLAPGWRLGYASRNLISGHLQMGLRCLRLSLE
ncbi:hypothetical protein XI06_16570 [Bradyrhizobium sp. CCBAU 11434]|nr:hypothetical protein [Bradyrhizobium sp. CCBAU 11434]